MMTNKKPDERLDDLQVKGYEIIQKPGRFCFGMDAVLLSSYAKVKRGERALDLGTGTGILPILLEAKNPGLHYTGLEVQEESAEYGKKKRGNTTGWRTRSISLPVISKRRAAYLEMIRMNHCIQPTVYDWGTRPEK